MQVFPTILAAWVLATGGDAPQASPQASPRVVTATLYVPFRPTGDWGACVMNLAQRAAAPREDHIVADAATWEKLWNAWVANEQKPNIDFKKCVVLVFTANGPNIPEPRLYPAGGRIVGTVGRTVLGGPGFGYRFLLVERAGVTSMLGRALE